MGWLSSFFAPDPETGKDTQCAVKVDSNGAVTDFIYGTEHDKDGGKHGHVWNLGPETDDDSISGRDVKEGNSSNSK